MPHESGHYAWDDETSQLIYEEGDDLFAPENASRLADQSVVEEIDPLPDRRPERPSVLDWFSREHPNQSALIPDDHQLRAIKNEYPNVHRYWVFLHEQRDKARANPHTLRVRGQEVDAEQYWDQKIRDYNPSASRDTAAVNRHQWDDYNRRIDQAVAANISAGMSRDQAFDAARRAIPKPSTVGVQGVVGRAVTGLDPEQYAAYMMERDQKIVKDAQTKERSVNVATQVRNDPDLSALLGEAITGGLGDWRSLGTSEAGPLQDRWQQIIRRWSSRYGEDFGEQHRQELDRLWDQLQHKQVTGTPANQEIVKQKRAEWIDSGGDPARFDPDEALRDEWAHQRWLQSEDGKRQTRLDEARRIAQQQEQEREENRRNFEENEIVTTWEEESKRTQNFQRNKIPGGIFRSSAEKNEQEAQEEFRKRQEEFRNMPGTDIRSVYLDVYRKYGYGGTSNNPNWSPEQVSEMVFQAVNEILIKNGSRTYERDGEQFAVLRSLHDRFYRETIDGSVKYDQNYDEFDSKSQMYFDSINELMELEKKLTGAKTTYFTGEAFAEMTIDGESPYAKLTQEEFARIQELKDKIYELKMDLGIAGDNLLNEAYSRKDWHAVNRMKHDNLMRLQKETLATFRNTYNSWDRHFKEKHNLPLKYSMLTGNQLDHAFGKLSNIYGEWAAKEYLRINSLDPGKMAAGSEAVYLMLGIAKDQVMNTLGLVAEIPQTGYSDAHMAIVQELARDKEARKATNAAISKYILESGFNEGGASLTTDAASGLGSLIAFMSIGKFGQLFSKATGVNSTVAGMSLMGLGVAKESYDRAIAAGVPSDLAKLKSSLDMMAEIGPMAGGVAISKAFPKVSPGWAKWLSGKNTTKVSQGIVTARRRAINDFVTSLPRDLATELVEEIMTGFMQQGTDWYFGLDPTGMDMDQILDMAYHTTISTLFGTLGSSSMQARMAGTQQEQYHKARQHYMQDMLQYVNPDGTFKRADIPPMMHTLDPKAVEDFIADPSRKNARILFGNRIDEALAKEGERGSSLETRQRLASQLDLMRPVDGIHINAKSPLEDLGYLDKPTPKDEPTIGPTERVQEEVIKPQQNAPVVVTVENADGTKSRIRVESKTGKPITQEEAEQKVEDQLNDGTLAGKDPRFDGSSVFRFDREPLIEDETAEVSPEVQAIDDQISELEDQRDAIDEAAMSGDALIGSRGAVDPVAETARIEQEIADLKKQRETALQGDAEVEVEAPELQPAEEVGIEDFEPTEDTSPDVGWDAPDFDPTAPLDESIEAEDLAAEVDDLDPGVEDIAPPPPEGVPGRVDRRRRWDNLDKLNALINEKDAIFAEIQDLEQTIINPDVGPNDRSLAEAAKKQKEKRLQEITKEQNERVAARDRKSPADVTFGETVEVTDDVYNETLDSDEMAPEIATSIAKKIINGETLTDNETSLYRGWEKGNAAIKAEVDRLSTPGEQTETSEVSEDGNYYFDEDTDTWQPTEQATQSMLQQNQKWDASKRQWVRTLPSERAPTTKSYGSNARQWTPEQQQEKDDEAFAQWKAKPGNENAEIVTLDESDPDAQRVTSFAEQFGLRIVFATGTSADGMAAFDPTVVGGRMDATGVIVINADMKGDALFEVAAHEIAHGTGLDLDSDVMPQGFEVANDQELEDIWNDFLDGLDPVSRTANLAKASSNPQFARREAMAMYIGKFFRSESFRNEVMGKRPGLVRKVIEFFNVFKPKMAPEQRRVIEAIKRRLNQEGYDTREGMQAVVPDVKPILLKSDLQKELEAKSPQELMQQAKDLGLKVVGRSPEALRQEIAKALAAQSAAEGTAPTVEQADENAKKKAESLSPEEVDATRKRLDERDRQLGDDLRNAGLLSQRAIPQEALSPTGLPNIIDDLLDSDTGKPNPNSRFEIVEEITDHRRAEKLWDEGADLYYEHEQAEGDLIKIDSKEMFDNIGSTPIYVVSRTDKAPAPLFSARRDPDSPVIPEVKEAYEQLVGKDITLDQYVEIVNKTVDPYDAAPNPTSNAAMQKALGKRSDVINVPIKNGTDIGFRVDINAWLHHGVWVVSLHGDGPVSHRSTAQATNVTFAQTDAAQRTSQRIIEGRQNKTSFAKIQGKFVNASANSNYKLAQEAVENKDGSWTQVGFDPRRHSYFYDRNSGDQILSGDKMVQVGGLVLVQNAVRKKPSAAPAPLFSERKRPSGPVSTEAAVQKIQLENLAPEANQDFFEFWTKVLDQTGRRFKASSRNYGVVAKQAVQDAMEFFKANPRFATYYQSDTSLTRAYIETVTGPISNVEFDLYRLVAGLTSPSTKLPDNMIDTLRVFELYKEKGNFNFIIPTTTEVRQSVSKKTGELEWNKDGTPKMVGGNVTYDKEATGFLFRSTTGATKARSILAVQQKIDEVGLEETVNWLLEPASIEQLEQDKINLGYANLGHKPEIQQVVQEATGQSELIPRIFMFGPKVGAYAMNVMGNVEYTTTDIWESRFIRSYFAGMFEKGTGLPESVEEQKVFQQFSSAFNEEFKNETGLDLDAASLQAIRWFYILDALNKAGYKYAKTNDTISGYTAAASRELFGIDPESGGPSSEASRKREEFRNLNRERLGRFNGTILSTGRTSQRLGRSHPDGKRGSLTPEKFVEIASANKAAHKFGSSVDVYSPEQYADAELIVAQDENGETATVVITADGEIGSLTKSRGGSTELVEAAMAAAFESGDVVWANSFDTTLPRRYAAIGLQAVARIPFDPTQKPDDWDADAYAKFNDGQPDIVFYTYTGIPHQYNPETVPTVDSWPTGEAKAKQGTSNPLFSERSADKRKVDVAKKMAESAMERIATGKSMYEAVNATLEAAGVNLSDFYADPNQYPKVVQLKNLIEGFVKGGHRKANSSVDKAAGYLDQSGTTAAMEAILEEVDKTVSGAPEKKHLEDMAVEAMNGIESMEELAKHVDVLLTHFREFRRPLKDREQAAVILVLNYHMADLNGLGQQLNAAIEDGDSDNASKIANEISALEKKIEEMALDNIAIGTEAGRALVSRRLGDTFRTVKMDIASILNRAIATKREKLTGDEKDTLMSLYNEHERLKKEIEEMRESVAEEQANSVIYAKSRKGRKKRTMQQATAKKPSIKDFELAAKLEQLAKERAC